MGALADDGLARFGVRPARTAKLVAGNGLSTLLADPVVLALAQEDHAGFAEALGRPEKEVAELLSARGDMELTGAEATALVLRQEGVRLAFAYAGTSELALCDSLVRVPDMRLVNGRGDGATVFMAAGASLLAPGRAAAVLHGARGLTNALGAIADARRNEVGLLAVVGLPSTSSARFLPPHGEPDLLARIRTFATWSYEAGPVPADRRERTARAARYVEAVRTALRRCRTAPTGPVLVGLPQDVAETPWLPLSTLDTPAAADDRPPSDLDHARRQLAATRRPVVLVDDYLLRHDGAKQALADFAGRLGAPVLQIRYHRGAMLFERLRTTDVPSFSGWYDPADPVHRELMDSADLLVTVEDRNAYPRVLGPLPGCRKLAITSDAHKAAKNDYLRDGDVVVEGNPVTLLRALTDGRVAAAAPEAPEPAAESDPDTGPVAALRTGVVEALAEALRDAAVPVIVDDSQMFGGLVCERYDLLPPAVRVFGDHCGFVGSGISYATGLAVSEPGVRVLCLLGDQAFVNGLQGLVAAGEERAAVVFVVCNNGRSVSLFTQAAVHPEWFDELTHPHLRNPENVDYAAAARALGLAAWQVEVRPDGTLDAGLAELDRALREAVATGEPSLVELRLPPDPALWAGIWLAHGYDEVVPAVTGE